MSGEPTGPSGAGPSGTDPSGDGPGGTGDPGATGAGGPPVPGAGDDRRRPSGRLGEGPLADCLVVLGSYLALGVVCGVLWWLVVDPAVFTKVDDGGSMGELELGKRFRGDGWYAVIGIVAGLASGLALTWFRSRDHRLTTALVFLGSCLAAAVTAVVGRALGPDDADRVLAAADPGTKVPVELVVTADVAYLVWPIAALVGALVVLWSPPREGEL